MGDRARRSTGKKPRETVYDAYGAIVQMAKVDGYVMCRRPRYSPFVLPEKDWARLPREPLPEGSIVPAVSGNTIQWEPIRLNLLRGLVEDADA